MVAFGMTDKRKQAAPRWRWTESMAASIQAIMTAPTSRAANKGGGVKS